MAVNDNPATPRRRPERGKRGFAHAAELVSDHVRNIGEQRGFAVSRLLTHWEEIAGAEAAQMAVPVDIRYRPGTIAATLTLLTTGAHAPILQTQLPALRDRVNACYGYKAIERIRITQTAGTGFAEGRVAFRHRAAAKKQPRKPAELPLELRSELEAVSDPKLRAALERLGRNILSRTMTELENS